MNWIILLACNDASVDASPPATPVVEVTPTDELIALASSGTDTAARGEAIVALVERGEGVHTLRSIQQDMQNPEIVRLWAAAGRIALADAGELDELAALRRPWPELERPIALRRAELGGDS